MASTFAAPVILAAVRTLLVTNTSLTATLATAAAGLGGGPAIYAEGAVPQGAVFPYLTLGAPTETPWNTLGPANLPKWGSIATFQVKALSKEMGDDGNYARMGFVKTQLDGAPLTVAGYPTAFCEYDNLGLPYSETIGGVVIRQLPMIFRVSVHQS
jgi:Protein of unknown function (DUF3168)